MKLDKDELKEFLTIDKMEELLEELGAEPITKNNVIICKTICHAGDSHKLYYYENTRLFKCYTGCDESTFDIFQLIIKLQSHEGNDCSLPKAMQIVGRFFNLSFEDIIEENNFNTQKEIEDWTIINKYKYIISREGYKTIKNYFKQKYDKYILEFLPKPNLKNWEKEGITKEVCDFHNICYDPIAQAIIIPHYDIDNNLIGIRERTLIKEEEVYGKYKPAILNGKMYNHPLGNNLYNLNNSKDNIKKSGIAIVFESEKATLQYSSFFGIENDISVAVCGSSLTQEQINLLLNLNIKEICIAFDRQYQDVNNKEGKKWISKLKHFNDLYSSYTQISFIFDKENLLDYKDAPTDKGKETFLTLFNKRIII